MKATYKARAFGNGRVAQFYCGKWRAVDHGRTVVLRYLAVLEQVMREVTGEGFRLNSLKHTGRGEDRRNDKLEAARFGIPKAFRQYARRFT